ncbi:unnamed protein product [Linum trigynum]|uniref:Uncharacterized protein n=1 Tax=Linum trigynum TaxID=586398 RepID=A0AAV2D7W8_9ROSI
MTVWRDGKRPDWVWFLLNPVLSRHFLISISARVLGKQLMGPQLLGGDDRGTRNGGCQLWPRAAGERGSLSSNHMSEFHSSPSLSISISAAAMEGELGHRSSRFLDWD